MTDEWIPDGGKTLQTADEILRFAEFNVMLDMVFIPAMITASQGFLGLPVVNQIFVFMVHRCGEVFYKESARLIDFKLIDNIVGAEKDAVNKAAADLKQIIMLPEQVQDPAALAKAKEEFRKKYADLITFARKSPPK